MVQSSILALLGVTKKYPGVIALDNISINFKKGEIHALVGENGAGKSTLIKILTGAIKPDTGEIEVNGTRYRKLTPYKALYKLGISAIYQEFTLVPSLTVAENIFFGKEIRSGIFIDTKRMHSITEEVLKTLDVEINPKTLVKHLSTASQQIIEIAKAVSKDINVLIMDEPSASLTLDEIENMFKIIRSLSQKGITVIYISHRLEEALEISDRITVLRNGKLISTLDTNKTNRKELISLMIGKELGERYPKRDIPFGEPFFEVKNLNSKNFLKNINFTLKRGEILGFSGLVGAGKTELARAIFGADPIDSGEIYIGEKKLENKSPSYAVMNGIGLIPEDRKQQGILPRLSVKDNMTYSFLKQISRFGIINKKKEENIVNIYKNRLGIRTPSLDQKVEHLSGGNQQKVVLSKWLASNCKVLIFDEPTRGIDVGAKQEIYKLINNLAEEGKGIIFISSELPELIGMSDKILVMKEGRIVGSLSKEEATQDAILDIVSSKLGNGKEEK